MARGSLVKEEITKKILDTFDGSFRYEKEIRIPMLENGELIQVKVTLTAAKTNVAHGEDTVVPGAATPATNSQSSELTEEEKKETADLLASLNL